MVFTSSMHDFSPRNKLKITVVRAIFYFAFANLALGSKPHEAACSKSRVESTDLHCILTTNINKCRGGERRRGKNDRSSPRQSVFQLPRRGLSSLRSWRYCVGARLKFWRRSRVPKKGSRDGAVFLAASPLVTAPPIFWRSFLLRTAPHYLNAWNRLRAVLCGCEIKVLAAEPCSRKKGVGTRRLNRHQISIDYINFYNSSAAKSHSTTTQYRQLRRVGYLQKVDSKWDESCDFFRILLREMTINQMILKSIAR